jgi:hypothetical protein
LQGTPKFTQIGIFGLKILPSGNTVEKKKRWPLMVTGMEAF